MEEEVPEPNDAWWIKPLHMKSTVILVLMLIIFCHIAREVAVQGITYENAIGLHVLYVLMYSVFESFEDNAAQE